MKTLNIFALSVFALVLAVGLVSADITLSPTTNSDSISHGSSDTFIFTIASDGECSAGQCTLVNIAAVASTLTSGSDTIGSGNITFSTLPTSIANDTTSSAITVTMAVPSNQVAGTYIGTVTVGGDHSETSNAVSTQNIDLTVTVASHSSLSVSSSTISTSSNSTTIIVKNEGNTALPTITLNTTGALSVDLTGTSVVNNVISTLAAGDSQTVTVTSTSTSSDLISGSATITATSGATTASGTVSLAGDYCKFDNLGSDLDIDVEINNKEGFGDDDKWYPFDDVEIEVTVDNKGNHDIDDIEVEWGLYNTKTGKFIQDDNEKEFNLKDGKDDTVIFTIDLDDNIDDFEDGDFVLYVRATGKYDDSDSANDGEEICEDASESIEIVSDQFVILDDITFSEEVSCGSEVQITADVWNIGDSDEDEVEVLIRSSELGISERIEVGDISEFDKESFTTTVTIPANAQEKNYIVNFLVFDEDNDLFENDDDDESEYKETLTVSGSCSTSSTESTISAQLVSGGNAGETLVIESTITNTGSSLDTYTISAVNHADWADSGVIAPTNLVLSAGQSGIVKFTFEVKDDASGEKTFDILASSGNNAAVSQPVVFSITEGGFNWFGLGSSDEEGSNWYLWIIGALNVLLVIIIIVVALRIAKS